MKRKNQANNKKLKIMYHKPSNNCNKKIIHQDIISIMNNFHLPPIMEDPIVEKVNHHRKKIQKTPDNL